MTGAADRLGAVLATGLAGAGYNVLIHYRSGAEKASNLADQINVDGGAAATVQADLTDRTDRAALIDTASKHFGPLNVLVNNASIYEKDSPATLQEDQWDRHFAIHAEAPVFLARDFAAQLPAGTTGNIINIIDERVLHSDPAAFSYALSKSVLWGATRTLAQNLAPAVRVNGIGPGAIIPEAGQSQQSFEARSALTLMGQTAGPDDILKTMLFLLNSPTITGQMIAVDAGEHLTWPPQRGPTPRTK